MSVITTLGFDISHTLLVITKSGIKPTKIVALVGTIKGEVDPRAETAYTMLKQFANMIGAEVEKIHVDVTDIQEAVNKIFKVLDENTPAILDIGGGLRLLVIETFMAYELLNPSKRNSITVYIALEGRNELINIDVNSIKRRFDETRRLDNLQKKILKIIEEKGVATPKEILHELSNSGTKISKQQLAKILTKLLNMGLIEKIDRGKYKYKP
ncbi:hypothetical protein QPL79_08560 [Ignisphaera sp. 4213-co]|uniref:CRISPR locus-related DNA-binding protein n=1 Tax=Ignisphaera cupida TaxID=3050454 RepID=A0ABD4Z913_9CREN|nr:hypothetical protein [Ignisphaera sp. 4213-co]MDK6029413.1 hypothetical protein [Ignisphaera sp. 4213-co]